MILRRLSLALGVSLLLSCPLVYCLSSYDIPLDTPISSLVSSAKSHLARGKSQDALVYFDVAINRDPRNYLTIFQRGATYLSLGKNAQAEDDFNRVLSIKPDFEGALLQRAKIKSRNGDWAGAKDDYRKADATTGEEYAQLEESEKAAELAVEAEKAGDYEACVTHAGTAIYVASTTVGLRQLRARCRFERGEVMEGTADLQHVLQLSPSSTDPHIQISSMLFYSLGETEKGLAQIRRCLHSDPDSKSCKQLHRQEKKVNKVIEQISGFTGKRQYNSAVKLLIESEDDAGLIRTVKDDVNELKEAGTIHKNAPNELYARLVEMACEFYGEANNRNKAVPYCDEALTLNPNSLFGLLSKAQRQLDASEFEPCIATLNHAKEHHPGSSQVGQLLQKAQIALKRSKTKDYYKVLGVSNDADARTIKSRYRKLVKEHHPDKAVNQGIAKEEAEKKMATINEAYEVLSDPELRARFDRGDDPNSQEHQGNPFHGSPFGQGPGGQQFFFRGGSQGQHFQFQQQQFHFGGM